MEYMLTPYSTKLETHAWWEGAFTEQELNILQEMAKASTTAGQIGGIGEVNNNLRRSEVTWLSNKKKTRWVFEKLNHAISSLNAQYFQFDLTGFGEPIQLTNYKESNEGFYSWHQDFGRAGQSRKLSVTLQLTDPSEYEGGNLQLLTGSEPLTIKKQRGLIIVFPSWTVHQVTPVTKGSRQSLVTWITGPSFK
jgi:PKHD-type hydroxylase